jgi:hypothetical protein
VTARDDALGEDIAQDVVSALVPLGGSVGKRLYRAIAREWTRNRSTALGAAVAASGLSREDFEEWAGREPRAIPLYLKVLWAAGMNGHEETLRAMGVVLGAAARATAEGDDEGFEDAELALRAMEDLTPRHFRVLATLRRGQVRGSGDMGEFMPEDVSQACGIGKDVAHQCLLNLAAAGLAVSTPVFNGTAYPPTALGHAVMEAAQAQAE